MFKPTQEAADSMLNQFLPKAGRDYAVNRNFDNGPTKHEGVSRLSPWVRMRMLPEWKIIKCVLGQNSASEAGKFIDEVCWRTYWKGWLQLRPTIWEDYLNEFTMQLEQWNGNEHYHKTIKGQSGIECLDAWTRELIETGYLHNHARMWYASIWIHTLQLPWTLGAAFFLTHLLDGDPAANTLSWRWVAGLHTAGKTYLARPDNIRKYTNNRFRVNEPLVEKPLALDRAPLPKPRPLSALEEPTIGKKLGLIVQEDDLSVLDWICKKYDAIPFAGLFLRDVYTANQISRTVINFRFACMQDVLRKKGLLLDSIEATVNWAKNEQLDAVIMAEVPVGFWSNSLKTLEAALEQEGVTLYQMRHWWDSILQPHATAGFFRFKKMIPKVLSKLDS